MPNLPRLGLVLGLLALAACGPPEMSPEAAIEAYREAVKRGDAERAVDLLEMAADGGDFQALRELATVYNRGRVEGRFQTGEHASIPVRTSSFKSTRTEWRYERALRQGAEQNDPAALHAIAARVMGHDFASGDWHEPTEADRDSARAILHRLDDLGADPFQRALLALNLGDRAGHRWRLREGRDAGDPRACVWLFYADNRGEPFTAANTALSLDRYEACRDLAEPDQLDEFDHAGRTVTGLRKEAAGGNGAASALLDSLAHLGVFERHPRLASVNAPSTTDA